MQRMTYNMDFSTRDEFPEFLNEYELKGIGAEIGVQNGSYSEIILNKWKGTTLFSIDAWLQFEETEYRDVANVSDEIHLINYAATCMKLRRFGDRSIILRMTSEEAAKIIPKKTLDFCYIDANHSYDGVVKDLELWIPKIKIGGIICGHDFREDGEHSDKDGRIFGLFGVQKAVLEYSDKYNWDLYITKNDDSPSWFAFIN